MRIRVYFPAWRRSPAIANSIAMAMMYARPTSTAALTGAMTYKEQVA